MGSIGERIRELRGEWQQSELSEKLGVHKNTVNNYERDARSPDVKTLLKILNLFPDTNPAWLLTGEGSKKITEPVKEGYLVFPELKVSAKGRQVEGEQIVDFISFKEEWVRNSLGVPQKDLALLTVRGDAMSPTLSDGDIVLVDLRSSRIEESAIYILEFNNAFLVKRIQRKLDGSIVVKSDNPVYEQEVLSDKQVKSLKVAGRVVWSGKRM